jgi:hypothetical protein
LMGTKNTFETQMAQKGTNVAQTRFSICHLWGGGDRRLSASALLTG